MPPLASEHNAASKPTVATGLLLLWLIPQVLALLVATTRVALWARYPQPGELMSLRLLVTTQLVLASLLFPILLRDRGSAVVVIASAWPMALVAGSLSASPLKITLAAELFVIAYLIALACWMPHLRSLPARCIAVALASLWTIGGPLLVYLRYEFNEGAPALSDWMAGPIVAIQHHLSGAAGLLASCVCFGAIAASGLGCALVLRRDIFRTTNPHSA